MDNDRLKLLEALQEFLMGMPDEEEKPAMPAMADEKPDALKVEMMSVGKADDDEENPLAKLGKMK